MNCVIRNITENEDGTISFDFGKVSSFNDSDTTIVVPTEGVLFHETFDKCNGKGGKDGRIYTVSGQYVGKDLNSLPKGIYIVDGKKVLR